MSSSLSVSNTAPKSIFNEEKENGQNTAFRLTDTKALEDGIWGLLHHLIGNALTDAHPLLQRSASTCRASDEFFINLSPASKGSPGGVKIAAEDIILISKKDVKLPGENLIHLIPLIIIFCVITLWVFSHPVADFSKEDGKLEGANVQNIVNETVLSSVVKLEDLDRNQRIGKGLVNEKSG